MGGILTLTFTEVKDNVGTTFFALSFISMDAHVNTVIVTDLFVDGS